MLQTLAHPLIDAGVSAFNVSVDTLDPVRFREVTGMDRLEEVLAGVDAVLAAGSASVKLNAVLMKGVNDGDAELGDWFDWVRDRPVSVRFIELMRTGENRELFDRRHVSAGELRFRLLRSGWVPRDRIEGDGPAVEVEHPDYRGRIGIIAPYAEGFCGDCNRLRISSRGALRLCLFGNGDRSLRHLLQSPSQKNELLDAVRAFLLDKAPSHHLHEGNHGITRNLSGIGG